MKHAILVFLAAFLFSSCSVMNHLDEASTLNEYSKEQDAIGAMVRDRDKRFSEFLDRIRAGTDLPDLKDSSAVLNYLGKPILVKTVKERGAKRARWLYRYQHFKNDSPKVYFVISQDGRVDYWFVTNPPNYVMPTIIDVSENKPQP